MITPPGSPLDAHAPPPPGPGETDSPTFGELHRLAAEYSAGITDIARERRERVASRKRSVELIERDEFLQDKRARYMLAVVEKKRAKVLGRAREEQRRRPAKRRKVARPPPPPAGVDVTVSSAEASAEESAGEEAPIPRPKYGEDSDYQMEVVEQWEALVDETSELDCLDSYVRSVKEMQMGYAKNREEQWAYVAEDDRRIRAAEEREQRAERRLVDIQRKLADLAEHMMENATVIQNVADVMRGNAAKMRDAAADMKGKLETISAD